MASRDLTVSLGWGLSFVLYQSTEVVTRFSGKLATAMQMVFAGLVLLTKALSPDVAIWTAFVSLFQYATVATTALSMVDYLWAGSQRLAKRGQD